MNARDYLALLRARKLLIGACVVVCLLLAGVVTVLMPRSYASTVTFYVVASSPSTQQNGASDNYQGAQLSTERVKSYAELLTGTRVAQDAAAALGGGTTPEDVQDAVSASSVAETVIITLTATDGSPTRAQAIATAVSGAFTRLVRQLETPGGTVDLAPSVLVDTPGGAPVDAPAVTAQVLQAASVPGPAVSPSLRLNLIIGLLVGLLLGFAAAVTRHTLDTAVRSADDLADAAGAPVLGSVPEDGDTARTPVSLTATDGRGAARTEAYRRIRATVEAAGTDGAHRVLVVASAVPENGSTTTAVNLAAALAAVGSRVVLVEGDLRRPRLAERLDLAGPAGLAGVAAGRSTLDAAVRTWTPGGFDVLVAGGAPERPNELLASRRTAAALAELRTRYDVVVIDSPPVLPVADAAALGAHADGVVLVARWGHTTRPQIESAVTFLRSVSVPVLGAILSRTPKTRDAAWTYPAAPVRGSGADDVDAAAEPTVADQAAADPTVAGPAPAEPAVKTEPVAKSESGSGTPAQRTRKRQPATGPGGQRTSSTRTAR